MQKKPTPESPSVNKVRLEPPCIRLILQTEEVPVTERKEETPIKSVLTTSLHLQKIVRRQDTSQGKGIAFRILGFHSSNEQKEKKKSLLNKNASDTEKGVSRKDKKITAMLVGQNCGFAFFYVLG